MKNQPEKRNVGRPRKYELEPIDATAQELAQAIFRVADRPEPGDGDEEKDDDQNPFPV